MEKKEKVLEDSKFVGKAELCLHLGISSPTLLNYVLLHITGLKKKGEKPLFEYHDWLKRRLIPRSWFNYLIEHLS